MTEVDILIVGAGAAGLSCGIRAVTAGVRSVLIADCSETLGGILPQCLHRGFGLQYYGEELTGPEFLTRLSSELPDSLDIRLSATVMNISGDKTAWLSSANGFEQIGFRELILATGCRETSIWSLGIGGTRPAGVFSAGLAQRLINLDSAEFGDRIVILGSGDVGLVMAGRFSELGKKPIALIEKRPQLGGLVRNQKRYVLENQIPVILNASITELHGEKQLSAVTVRHSDTGETELIPCDTLITALGLVPDRTLLRKIGREGSYPDWVHLAGNCDFVHDIVDRVLRSGEKIGAETAARLLR